MEREEGQAAAEERPALRKRRRGGGSARVGSAPKPNASLFVGYVEDGETIEMIMKKFETLEEIQRSAGGAPGQAGGKDAPEKPDMVTAQAAAAQDQALDEQTLQEVFKATSSFTVRSATRQADALEAFLEDGWEMDGVTTAVTDDGEPVYLVGDGTDDDLWEEVFGSKKRRGGRAPRGKTRVEGVTQVAFVSDMRGRFVTGLKRVRKVDPNAIAYQRIPNEIPRSWAKRIQPWHPPDAVHRHTAWNAAATTCSERTFANRREQPERCLAVRVASILDATEWSQQVMARGPFEGIVLSPPWRQRRLVPEGACAAQAQEGIEPEDLAKLGLGRKDLMESGFVYVWTPKHLILRVLRVLEKMDLHYVENAVYVKQRVDNKLFCEPSRYFRQSKETLLICRRGIKSRSTGKISWTRVEMRHQRTTDVHFDFAKSAPTQKQQEPLERCQALPHSYVHNMAETMLPHARFNPCKASPDAAAADAPAPLSDSEEARRGKLLHLWAPHAASAGAEAPQRTGWVSVVESPA